MFEHRLSKVVEEHLFLQVFLPRGFAPRRSQDGPKMAPRRPQDNPLSIFSPSYFQLTSNLPPRCHLVGQVASKMAPSCLSPGSFFYGFSYVFAILGHLTSNLSPTCLQDAILLAKLLPRWLQDASKTQTWAQRGPTWRILGSSWPPLESKNAHVPMVF